MFAAQNAGHIVAPPQIEAIIRSIWGENTPIALAIASCESGLNPASVSAPNYDGLRNYGLFQLHGREILDPVENAQIAKGMYDNRGTQPWVGSKSCWLTKV